MKYMKSFNELNESIDKGYSPRIKCVCNHPKNQHKENGKCSNIDCDCKKYNERYPIEFSKVDIEN